MCMLQCFVCISVWVSISLTESYLPSSVLNFPCDHSHLTQKMTVGLRVCVCLCVYLVIASDITTLISSLVIAEPLWAERLNNERAEGPCVLLCVKETVDVCVQSIILR